MLRQPMPEIAMPEIAHAIKSNCQKEHLPEIAHSRNSTCHKWHMPEIAHARMRTLSAFVAARRLSAENGEINHSDGMCVCVCGAYVCRDVQRRMEK